MKILIEMEAEEFLKANQAGILEDLAKLFAKKIMVAEVVAEPKVKPVVVTESIVEKVVEAVVVPVVASVEVIDVKDLISKATELSNNGFRSDIIALLASIGVKSISTLSTEQYPLFKAGLEAIGGNQ